MAKPRDEDVLELRPVKIFILLQCLANPSATSVPDRRQATVRSMFKNEIA